MLPIDFPEKNATLGAPTGMDNCLPLAVHRTGDACVSCWRPSLRERLSLLFFGRLWVFVYFGNTQPPIALSGTRTVFSKAEV